MKEYTDYCWKHLQIHPLVIRRFCCDPSWRLERRILDHPYFTFFESGRAILELDGRRHRLKGGEWIVFASEIPHAMIPENESPCVMTNVHFQALIHEGIDLAERWKLSGIYSTPEGINASVFREFADLMLSPVSGSYRYIQSMIYALLWKVGSVKQVAPAGNWRKLEPALILIERRLSDPDLSCGDLAAAAGLSVVYCRQLFRGEFGLSPLAYLHRVRIQYAKQLLCQTVLSVKEIAFKAGFADINFFHRIFKRQTGTTPAAFRLDPA